MDKRFIPVAMLAGALALAGCGGGSSTTAPGSELPTCGDDEMLVGSQCVAKVVEEEEEEEETGGFSAATLPGTASGIVYNADSRRTILVGKGKHAIAGSNVSVMCEVDTGCAYRVVASGNNVSVETTGGATVVLTNPVPQTATEQASGHWLSKAGAAGAIPIDGSNNLEITAGGVKYAFTAGARQATTPDDKVANLLLLHNRAPSASDDDDAPGDQRTDFLVWGSWKEPVQGSAPDKEHSVWHGSMPYKGTPSEDLATATYFSADAFNGFVNGADWASGDVRIVANFGDQTISGVIGEGVTADSQTQAELDALGSGPDSQDLFSHISLKGTIGSSVSGTATIRGTGDIGTDSTDDRLAPSSGTWNAGFFGPGPTAPTGIAGDLSVTRPAAGATSSTATNPHGRVTKLTVTGSFGATRE